jgi:hypothetical protein
MLAAGREHCDDIYALSGEGAFEEMVGMLFPSPSVLKQFLYRFHDEITDAEVEARRTGTTARTTQRRKSRASKVDTIGLTGYYTEPKVVYPSGVLPMAPLQVWGIVTQ